jgi:hypothetical protein
VASLIQLDTSLSFGGIFDLMASSSSGAGIPDYGTLSNAAAQASTPNKGASKDPTVVEQVARLPPVQHDSRIDCQQHLHAPRCSKSHTMEWYFTHL